MYKYRLKFAKTGKMKYIGHLDLLRTFQRAVKRAKLPVRYSEGFNPHQKNSFALPLGLGMESVAEYADIELDEEMNNEEIISRLNAVLPDGFKFMSAEKISVNEKTAPLISSASYEVKISEAAAGAFDGKTAADIDPNLYEISIASDGNGVLLRMTLAAGSVKSLKPQKVIEYIYSLAGEEPSDVTYKRTALGIEGVK